MATPTRRFLILGLDGGTFDLLDPLMAAGELPFLRSLAPTQSEPPFIVAQTVVLVIFVVLGLLAVRRFHPVGVPA